MHHSVIETWGWDHFTQATNQTLMITVKLSNHAPVTTYSTLATDTIDCHYKRSLNKSLDHSVIETWGVGSFDSGQQTANYKSPSPLPGHTPVTTYSTLATDTIDCHYKRSLNKSLDHSVIETWGWARLTRGNKQPITNHLHHFLDTP